MSHNSGHEWKQRLGVGADDAAADSALANYIKWVSPSLT